MIRTGKRAEVLRELLQSAGFEASSLLPARPTGAEHSAELLKLYRRLGGLQRVPILRPGAWDLVFDGPMVIELDEELHFNRYRALTPTASWARDLPWAADYQRLCAAREPECLSAGSWGKRWTNPSAERMFSGGPTGDLSSEGAPRWKQRALYDAIKDMMPTNDRKVSIARLSIYDDIDGVILGDAIQRNATVSPQSIQALVERRTAWGRPGR